MMIPPDRSLMQWLAYEILRFLEDDEERMKILLHAHEGELL